MHFYVFILLTFMLKSYSKISNVVLCQYVTVLKHVTK
jgi:hypothetical protein